MNHTMLALFGAAIGLYALQAAGAYYQMRQYKRAVHRLHQLGNVGIGQKRGGFSFGYLVLVVCDNNGIIQTVERMRGITCFATFQPLTQLNGRTLTGSHIEEWQAAFRSMDKSSGASTRDIYRRWKRWICACTRSITVRKHCSIAP